MEGGVLGYGLRPTGSPRSPVFKGKTNKKDPEEADQERRRDVSGSGWGRSDFKAQGVSPSVRLQREVKKNDKKPHYEPSWCHS